MLGLFYFLLSFLFGAILRGGIVVFVSSLLLFLRVVNCYFFCDVCLKCQFVVPSIYGFYV